MDTDHLSPTSNPKNILKIVRKTLWKQDGQKIALSPALVESCCVWKTEFDRWYEGKLLANTVFQ